MSILDDARVRPYGECTVVIEYGDRIDPQVHERVMAADRAVTAAAPGWLEETVPTYRSLLVRFDVLVASPAQVVDDLGSLAPLGGSDGPRHVEVVWEPDHGADLDHVADHVGCDPGDVVALLERDELRVYLVGFAPGFTYLGGVPEELHLARRTTPREPVAPGAVLLAAGQAALCPVSMPTGWWVVGHTGTALFDPDRSPPSSLAAGGRVRLTRR